MSNTNTSHAGAVVRIVIWSIVLCILCNIFIFFLVRNPGDSFPFFSIEMGFYNDDSYSTGDAEISEVIRSLDLDWTSGRVIVQLGEGEKATLTETYSDGTIPEENQKMRWKMENGRLSVKFRSPRFSFFFGTQKSKYLTLTIPAAWVEQSLDKTTVDTASADVEITGLRASKLDIDTASGDIKLHQCSVTTLDVDTASGTISAYELAAHSVNADTASGRVIVEGDVRELDVDTASGSVTLTLTGTTNKISADTASGDIQVNGEVYELDVNTASGDLTATLTGASRLIEMDTASGTARLSLSESIPGFTAKMDSLSGRVSIDGFTVTTHNHSYTYGDGSCRIDMDSASGSLYIQSVS